MTGIETMIFKRSDALIAELQTKTRGKLDYLLNDKHNRMSLFEKENRRGSPKIVTFKPAAAHLATPQYHRWHLSRDFPLRLLLYFEVYFKYKYAHGCLNVNHVVQLSVPES